MADKRIRILILDPDIGFAVRVRQALETLGKYRVNAFASSQAALEAMARDPHDFAVLDLGILDLELSQLIETLERLRPRVHIILSRNAAQPPDAPEIGARPTLVKPYHSRQLDELVEQILTQPTATPIPSKPQQSSSEDVQADPTFTQAIERLDRGESTVLLAQMPSPIESQPAEKASVESEPPIPPDATLRDVMTGKLPLTGRLKTPGVPMDLPPNSAERPQATPHLPEPEASHLALTQPTAATAQLALEVANDDSVPLAELIDHLAQGAQSLPPESRQAWLSPEALEEQPALVVGAIESQAATSKLESTLAAEWIERLKEPHSLARTTSDIAIDLKALSDEADPLAALALRTMQLVLQDTAAAALLLRKDAIVAAAGKMPDAAREKVIHEVQRMWEGNQAASAMIRPLKFDKTTTYLLYSIRTVDDLILTLISTDSVSVGMLSQMAKQLREALMNVPEPIRPAHPQEDNLREAAHHDEPLTSPEISAPMPSVIQDNSLPTPPAAETLPSRPTDLRPPEALRPSVEEKPSVKLEAPITCTVVLLPSKAEFTDEQVDSLSEWVRHAAVHQLWQVESIQVQPTHVIVQFTFPNTLSADAATQMLMRASAEQAQTTEIWAEARYIVTPARAITPQEVAEFMEYARQVLKPA